MRARMPRRSIHPVLQSMASDPIRIGHVGAGRWGQNVLRNFMALSNAHVVQVCDQAEHVLQRVVRQYPVGLRVTRHFGDLLRDDSLDGIVIATETPLHYRMAASALAAGKHVYVEKPMTQTVAEAEHLVRLTEESGRHLMVGHLLLYHPAFVYVQDLIRRGTLGEVYYLYSVRVNLGIVRQQENAFDSLGPHDVSVALAFLDRQPTAVAANGQAYLQRGIEDVVFATVYFEDGRIAHMHTSWLDPHKIRKVTVVGSRKMAVIDDTAGAEKVRLYDKGIGTGAPPYLDFGASMAIRSGDINIPKIPMQEPLRAECAHFADCVQSDTPPRSDARNGLAVVRVLEAVRESLRLGGKRVELVV